MVIYVLYKPTQVSLKITEFHTREFFLFLISVTSIVQDIFKA